MKKSLTIMASIMLFEISSVLFLYFLLYLILFVYFVGFAGFGSNGYFPIEGKLIFTAICTIFLLLSAYGIYRSIKLYKNNKLSFSKPIIFLLFILPIFLTFLLCYISGYPVQFHVLAQ